LLSGLQITFLLGLFPHSLNGIHYLALLRQKGIAQLGRPLNFVAEQFYDRWHSCKSLDARVPRLFFRCVGERLVFQALVFLQPTLQKNNFDGIC
jgi:hypothetical protein